jgi:hypothetical protein
MFQAESMIDSERAVLRTPQRNFFHGAQLARIVNPLMIPVRHASFENFLGRLKTFLFEVLTHFLFLGPAF